MTSSDTRQEEMAPDLDREERGADSEEGAESEENVNREQHTWWDGVWPAAIGTVAKDLAKNAGTIPTQKERTKELYSFLMSDDAQLPLLNGRPDILAFLVNIPGTKLIRVGYGLSPKVTSLLDPDGPKTFRMMTGDLEDNASTPAMISFPSSARDCSKFRVPTDDKVDSMREEWPDQWPVFKASELRDTRGVDSMIMKIAPVPFFVVQDGLEMDLSAEAVLERIQSMDDYREEYLQHAACFLKACLVQYPANHKKPSLDVTSFASRASSDDKTWSTLRFNQLCPDLAKNQAIQQASSAPTDMATVLKMLLEHNKAKNAPTPAAAATVDTEEAMDGTWEKKLGLSTTALANMLKFCGLKEGQESYLPSYLTKLGEKNNSKGDKDNIIHQVLSKLYYQDTEVPITSFLLAVIRERNWTGGEVMCTMANCMKGLSIFAMKDISDEALSRMNEEDEARFKATSTSPKDHMLSAKWKPEVPEETTELIKYFQRYVNVLSALSGGLNEHCAHAKQIVGKLKRWNPSACKAMKKEMIASIMWVTLKEARRSFMGIIDDVLPEFEDLLDCLDKKKEFIVMDLPAALVRNAVKEPEPKGPKRPTAPGEDGEPRPKRPRTPRPDTRVGQNMIIQEKCAQLLNVMSEHKISLSSLCAACNTPVQGLFPKGLCGQAAFFGQCYVRNCHFEHKKLEDKDVWKVLDGIMPALDNPNILIKKGQ